MAAISAIVDRRASHGLTQPDAAGVTSRQNHQRPNLFDAEQRGPGEQGGREQADGQCLRGGDEVEVKRRREGKVPGDEKRKGGLDYGADPNAEQASHETDQ